MTLLLLKWKHLDLGFCFLRGSTIWLTSTMRLCEISSNHGLKIQPVFTGPPSAPLHAPRDKAACCAFSHLDTKPAERHGAFPSTLNCHWFLLNQHIHACFTSTSEVASPGDHVHRGPEVTKLMHSWYLAGTGTSRDTADISHDFAYFAFLLKRLCYAIFCNFKNLRFLPENNSG